MEKNKRKKTFYWSMLGVISATIIVVPTTVVLVEQNNKISSNKIFANRILGIIEEDQNTNKQISIEKNQISVFQINETNFELYLDNLPVIENLVTEGNISNIPSSFSSSYEYVEKSNDINNPSLTIKVIIKAGSGSDLTEQSKSIKILNGFTSSNNYIEEVKNNYQESYSKNMIILKEESEGNEINQNNLLENLNGLEIFPEIVLKVNNFSKDLESKKITFSLNISIKNSNLNITTNNFEVNF